MLLSLRLVLVKPQQNHTKYYHVTIWLDYTWHTRRYWLLACLSHRTSGNQLYLHLASLPLYASQSHARTNFEVVECQNAHSVIIIKCQNIVRLRFAV